MTKVLYANDGEGKEISEYLKKKLSIPANAASFTVTFKCNCPITVSCEYYPVESSKE
jgi:hypothetical protein